MVLNDEILPDDIVRLLYEQQFLNPEDEDYENWNRGLITTFDLLIKKIQKLESERIFCRHTPEHFLDVARLMYIYALEEHLELPKELIYAAALLHDIGRAQQYQYNIPHDIAGVEIAREILTDLHFTEQEKELILSSIGHHRKGDSCSTLAALLYKADKQSRNCFLCSAASECYWSDDKKNMKIEY